MHFVQTSGVGQKNCPSLVACPKLFFWENKKQKNKQKITEEKLPSYFLRQDTCIPAFSIQFIGPNEAVCLSLMSPNELLYFKVPINSKSGISFHL